MTPTEHELVVPQMELGEIQINVSVWLKRVGQEVAAGERMLELSAGEVTVDLPSPATGRIIRQLVEEDDTVLPGQVLAVVLSDG